MMEVIKGMNDVEFRTWSFPAGSDDESPALWTLSAFMCGKCVADVPFSFTDERTAVMFARLVCELEAALPYVEDAKVPGPAMSDPWSPPRELIKSIKTVLMEAVNGFAVPSFAKAKGGAQ
jgi:hypothetical protein